MSGPTHAAAVDGSSATKRSQPHRLSPSSTPAADRPSSGNPMLSRRIMLLALLSTLLTPAQARRRGCSYGPRKANGKCPSRDGR